MVSRSGLRIPDIAGVAGQLPGLERPHDSVAIHDRAARSIDNVGAPLHRPEQLIVEEMIGLGHQRAVDRKDVNRPSE
jgi:hypothetical protein